jgi:hypothetical protein
VIGEYRSGRIWLLKEDGVAAAANAAHARAIDCLAEPRRSSHEWHVVLARDERAPEIDRLELTPKRLHRAGAHAPEGRGESIGPVAHAQPVEPCREFSTPTLDAGEHGQRFPVSDERLDSLPLDSLGKCLIGLAPRRASFVIEARVCADCQQ